MAFRFQDKGISPQRQRRNQAMDRLLQEAQANRRQKRLFGEPVSKGQRAKENLGRFMNLGKRR
jgi:hypothetical protein